MKKGISKVVEAWVVFVVLGGEGRKASHLGGGTLETAQADLAWAESKGLAAVAVRMDRYGVAEFRATSAVTSDLYEALQKEILDI